MKHLFFLLTFASSVGFSQPEQLYDIVFSSKSNFDFLKIFGGKLPARFSVLDSTEIWNPNNFYLNNFDLNNPEVMKKIMNDEHHQYHCCYLFSDVKLSAKISDAEKKELRNQAQLLDVKKKVKSGKKYTTLKTFLDSGFYFLVAEPIFTTDGKYAFLNISVKEKGKFLGEDRDEYFASIIIMLEKRANRWKQIGIKKHLIM